MLSLVSVHLRLVVASLESQDPFLHTPPDTRHFASPSSRLRMPLPRSSNTCAECRVRKVKCDGRRDTCSPCERLLLGCSFQRVPDGVHVIPDPDARSTIRRARRACKPCQAMKVRCSGDSPRCQRCASKDSNCVYAISKRSGASASDRGSTQSPSATQDFVSSGALLNTPRTPCAPATPAPRDNPTPTPSSKVPTEVTAISSFLDEAMVAKILEAFFQNIQPMPVYSFLHKASFIHRFEAGLMSPALLLALIGTTCELLDIGVSTEDIKVQTLILIIQSHHRQGRMAPPFILLAIASRFAYALRFNHEAPKLPFLEQECRRRLMWSLFILDTTFAGGIRDFSVCSAQSLHIQLPCQERNFDLDLEETTEPLQAGLVRSASVTVGSLGFYIRILWIRYRILQVTKEAVLSIGDEASHLPSDIERLAVELTEYEATLPQSLQFSERNMQLHAYSPQLGSYFLIHMWLRQCYCDLYRVVLTGLKEALGEDQIQHLDPTVVRALRWKCYESAERVSEFLGSVQIWKNRLAASGCEIPLCAYQCVRLLLRCYQQREAIHDCINPDMVQRLIRQCVNAVETMPSKTPMGIRIV
jgi:hypothetical protein